jgi:hypothetical protein
MEAAEKKDAAEQAVKEGGSFLQSGEHEQALAAFARAENLFGEPAE